MARCMLNKRVELRFVNSNCNPLGLVLDQGEALCFGSSTVRCGVCCQ